jgi:hypothetical protein
MLRSVIATFETHSIRSRIRGVDADENPRLVFPNVQLQTLSTDQATAAVSFIN